MASKDSASPHVNFNVYREVLDEDGYWNPTDEGSFEGGLQINIYGSKAHYLKLAQAIRDFAEIDSSKDGDFHQHFDGMNSDGVTEGLRSADGRTRLHIILRKDDVGDSIHLESFPH